MACPKRVHQKLPKNGHRKKTAATVHPGHLVFHAMPHPPLHIWAHPHNRSLQPLYFSLFLQEEGMSFCYKNQAKYGNARPNHGPPAQRSSSSASFMCTSTASIGGNQSIGDPGICGVTRPQVGGDDVFPHGHSTPIIIASESDCGSSYASPCDSSMTDSQSCKCRCLSGSTPSSRLVCLAPSSLSFPRSSVSVVGSSGSCASSPSFDVEESLGQLTSQWAPSLAIQAAPSGMCST